MLFVEVVGRQCSFLGEPSPLSDHLVNQCRAHCTEIQEEADLKGEGEQSSSFNFVLSFYGSCAPHHGRGEALATGL